MDGWIDGMREQQVCERVCEQETRPPGIPWCPCLPRPPPPFSGSPVIKALFPRALSHPRRTKSHLCSRVTPSPALESLATTARLFLAHARFVTRHLLWSSELFFPQSLARCLVIAVVSSLFPGRYVSTRLATLVPFCLLRPVVGSDRIPYQQK